MKRFLKPLTLVALLIVMAVGWHQWPRIRYANVHEAALLGDHAAVKWFLKHGVDVDVADIHGCTPLGWAAAGGYEEVVLLLLHNRADVNATQGSRGFTPLHLAAMAGRRDTVAFLLARSADVNRRDATGRTPLRAALDHHHARVAELLREHGGAE